MFNVHLNTKFKIFSDFFFHFIAASRNIIVVNNKLTRLISANDINFLQISCAHRHNYIFKIIVVSRIPLT